MTMMPIGVPKVAYKMPGSRGGEWVDIFNRLTRERIIFMGSEIDDEMANQIIGVLLVIFFSFFCISKNLISDIIYTQNSYHSTWITKIPTNRYISI
jgi:hypothetical protein